MYMLGISFWVDEAKLAESVVGRTMREMLTPPMANRQTAPALYLIVVKTLSLLFGASESVLRVFSFASLIIMLIAQGLLLRKIFRIGMVFTMFSVALSATLGHYMYYSNEFKPYMGDAAFVLIVLLGYYAYREGFLCKGIKSAVFLGLFFSVCMLFSSPVVFIAAAVFLVEFISRCIHKDRSAILYIIVGSLIFISIFALNYYLWLKPIVSDEGMVEYWADRKFNFFMISRADLNHNISIFRNLLKPIWDIMWIALPFGIFGFVISLVKRNIYTVVTAVFFFLLLVASAVDKYPIMPRLWMFFYVILFIYVFIFIDSIRISPPKVFAEKAVRTVILLILSIIILAPNLMTFTAYGKGADYTVQPGNQANPIIAYVKENIQEDEFLYSFGSANYILKYKIGYETNRIGNVSSDNILFGTEDVNKDIDWITETNGSYILFYHDNYQRIGPLIETLQRRGFMEMILDINDTYLYWFTNDITKVKASAVISTRETISNESRLYGILSIENTGAAILAPEKPLGYTDKSGKYDLRNYGRVFIILHRVNERLNVENALKEIILGEITSPIRPGEIAEVIIDRSDLDPDEYQIELVAYGKYLFREIGTKPVTLTVTE